MGRVSGRSGLCKKKNEIWLSPMTKTLIRTENSTTNWQHKDATKTSITQRLRTDLGRSIGVTTAIQLVWLNRFTGIQPSHKPQKPCNKKDTFKYLIIWLCNVYHKVSTTLFVMMQLESSRVIRSRNNKAVEWPNTRSIVLWVVRR